MWRALLVLGASIAMVRDAAALDPTRGLAQFARRHFEARDGMPISLANSLAQTPDGFLWVGGEEGLSRFDGATFRTFDRRNTPTLGANAFSALAVDSTGGLWAGMRDRGLVRLIDGELQRVAWTADGPDVQVRALAFDRAGDLWIATHGQGLVHLRDGKLVADLTVASGLPDNDVRAILVAR